MEQGAQTIYRAVAVLKGIADRNRQGTGMTELAAATGLTGPTVHRILKTLTDVGLALQQADKRYALGPLVYDLGLTAAPRFDLSNLCADITTRLADSTGDTVFFSRLSGHDMVCVSRTSGSFPVKTLITDVGLRRPLGVGAGGLAVLSALPEATRETLMQANADNYAAHGKSVDQIRQEVGAARELGHVVRVIPALGATTLSCPVRDQSRLPFGSISVSSISQRMTGDHLDSTLKALKDAVIEIEARIDFDLSNRVASY